MQPITNISDMLNIIDAVCADPHSVLGMHRVETDGKSRLVARVFIPGARSVAVVCPSTNGRWPLDMVHRDGFFDGVVKGRSQAIWFTNLDIKNTAAINKNDSAPPRLPTGIEAKGSLAINEVR